VRTRFLFVSVLLTATGAAPLAGQALGPRIAGPIIQDFGAVFQVDAPDFATPMGETKVVFEVKVGADQPEQRNSHIESLARLLNMSGQAGVPRENLKLALVVHGTAGKDLLDHEGYRAKYGMDNPNFELIQALRGFGVQVVLCGQTQMSRGLPRNQLAPGVQVALSAMTAMLALQNEGYNLISF